TEGGEADAIRAVDEVDGLGSAGRQSDLRQIDIAIGERQRRRGERLGDIGLRSPETLKPSEPAPSTNDKLRWKWNVVKSAPSSFPRVERCPGRDPVPRACASP